MYSVLALALFLFAALNAVALGLFVTIWLKGCLPSVGSILGMECDRYVESPLKRFKSNG
jgi:hypothetical protein